MRRVLLACLRPEAGVLSGPAAKPDDGGGEPARLPPAVDRLDGVGRAAGANEVGCVGVTELVADVAPGSGVPLGWRRGAVSGLWISVHLSLVSAVGALVRTKKLVSVLSARRVRSSRGRTPVATPLVLVLGGGG